MNKVFTVVVEDSRGTKDTLYIEADAENKAHEIAILTAKEAYGMESPVEAICSFEGVVVHTSSEDSYIASISRENENYSLRIDQRHC